MEAKLTNNDEFQIKTWPAWKSWWSKNNYTISKQVAGFKWETVDDEEIRSAFMKYDYTKSDLRKDKFVPVPKNRTEEFLEMFFEKIGGEWDSPLNEDGEEWDDEIMENFTKHMKAAA